MRKRGIWGLEAALVLGLGVALARAGDDDTTDKRPRKPNWRSTTAWSKITGWFESDDKDADKPDGEPKDSKADKKDADKKADPKKDDPKPTGAKAQKAPEVNRPAPEATSERARLEAEFFRRSAACLKLQEIAARTNDVELQRRAEQLSERAWELFNQRTAALSAGGSHLESDEAVLEKYLGDGKEVNLPKSAAHPAPGKDAASRAAAKEDKP
jgi:hypothetical protein